MNCNNCGSSNLYRHIADHPVEAKRAAYHCNSCGMCPAPVRISAISPVTTFGHAPKGIIARLLR